MRSVIITGVNGFIGSHLAKYYLSKNHKVIGIGIEETCNINEVNYFSADILTVGLDSILNENNADLIIHCAGNASVPESVKKPLFDFSLNTTMVYRLMESCKKYPNLKIINLSSASVYGNPKQLPIKETDEELPISPYALNKMLAEKICNYYRRNFNVDVVNVRIFSAYGPGLKKQLFWDMFQKIKSTGRLDLFGTGKESRDYIYIDDLVQAIDIIAQNSDKPLINIANGEESTIRQVAEHFVDCAGLSRDIISFNQKSREGDPLNWRADISYLKELGYEKKISLDEGISRYYKWVNSIEE